MLYVFLVDTGTMLTFEMDFAMQRVRDLQDAIARECHIPQEKQVLLISGGDSLSADERVCRYAAGTDTNPIFLFNKQSLESATPPAASTDYGSESHLRERVEDSLSLPPSYETLASRTGLAANFYEVAKEEFMVCKHLVFDQHLQHQGWLAVIANLEDVTHIFRAQSKLFFLQLEDFLTQREEKLSLLASFPSVIELLAKIPLLQSLETFSLACISTSEVEERPKTLLDWITAQETNKTLEHVMQKCQSDLEQFDEPTRQALIRETEAVLGQVDNDAMKEVRGLEGRLCQLEYFMQAASKLVAEQEQIFKSIENNQNNAIQIRDPSVLPELCEIHKHQIPQLLKNQEQLQDIKNKCCSAKVDLAVNLHKRLRWVMYVEKGLTELSSKIFFYKETLTKLKHHFEIICQISNSPEAYCRSVVEVVRRRQFSRKFIMFAKNLSGKCIEVRRDELIKRSEFDKFFHHHFLNALFPGLEDVPPAYATKCPDPFDDHLPLLTEDDVAALQSQVPELSESLRTFDRSSVSLCDLLPYQTSDLIKGDEVLDKRKPLRVGEVEEAAAPEAPLGILSQSVEIITTEESRLVTLKDYQVTTTTMLALPVETDLTAVSKEPRSPVASTVVSPELEDNPTNDTFMTADFYIDESMPSSMTELASSKKLAELQGILQDRTAQLEMKEREVTDNKRCIEELNAKLLLYEQRAKLVNDVVLSCCAPLKQDLEDVKTSVAISQSESLAELSSVHSSLAELVKVWNVTSEQIALESQEATVRSFDVSLNAVQEKLDSESAMLKRFVGENEELKSSLDNKSTECQCLVDEVAKLREESEASKKILLEIEVENEKLKADYKTESEKKDDLIKALQKATDQVNKTIQEKDVAFEEMEKKLENERFQLADAFKKEQAADEARISETVTQGLLVKHQQELNEAQNEFEQRLNGKEELVLRLTNECQNYIGKLQALVKENEEEINKLRLVYDSQLTEVKAKNKAITMELEQNKVLIDGLNTEIKQHLECIDQLKETVGKLSEQSAGESEESLGKSFSSLQVDSEAQTEEVTTETVDAETQSEFVYERVDAETQSEFDEKINAETQSEFDEKINAETQSEFVEEKVNVETQSEFVDERTDAETQSEFVDEKVNAETQSEYDVERINVETQSEFVDDKDKERKGNDKVLIDSDSQTDSSKMITEDIQTENEMFTSVLEDVDIQTENMLFVSVVEREREDIVEDVSVQTENIALMQDLNIQTENLTETVDFTIQTENLRNSQDVNIQTENVPVTRDVDVGTDDVPGKAVTVDADVQTETVPTTSPADSLLNVATADEFLFRSQTGKKELEGCIPLGSEIETFETGICELHSCPDISITAAQSEAANGLELPLRVDDYLPLQRHNEVVAKLKAQMEDEKTAAVLAVIDEQRHLNDELMEELLMKHKVEKQTLKSNYEAERQIHFNEALNQAVSERDRQIEELHKTISDLTNAVSGKPEASGGSTTATFKDVTSSRFVQGKLEEELAEAKQEILRLQSQLRLQSSSVFPVTSASMGHSVMGQSFGTLAEPGVHEKMLLDPSKQNLDKLKEKLVELSITGSVSEIIMQHVSICYRCKERDVVLFIWTPEFGHYLAYLSEDCPQHFLHMDSAAHFERSTSEFIETQKWLVGEVISLELCLAKKATNRFKVAVGTKFYRVKAKPWTLSCGLSLQKAPGPEGQATSKRDADNLDEKPITTNQS